MISCPNCNISDNITLRTWTVVSVDTEVRMRKKYCNACGVIFRTYELVFKNDANIEDISKKIKEAIKIYPSIIKPYRWEQNRLF